MTRLSLTSMLACLALLGAAEPDRWKGPDLADVARVLSKIPIPTESKTSISFASLTEGATVTVEDECIRLSTRKGGNAAQIVVRSKGDQEIDNPTKRDLQILVAVEVSDEDAERITRAFVTSKTLPVVRLSGKVGKSWVRRFASNDVIVIRLTDGQLE